MSKRVKSIILIVISFLINAFIIIQASLTPELSTAQSDWLGKILIGKINETVEVPQDIVDLESITLDNANKKADHTIIRGTTQRVDVTLLPTNVSDKVITYTTNKPESFNLVPRGNVCYVEALGEVGDKATITATSNKKSASYDFEIIDRKEPEFYKATLKSSTIFVNTSTKIDVLLKDDPTKPEKEIKDDQFNHIRYFDPLKLTYDVDNKAIAEVKNGYVIGKSFGFTNIYINKGKANEQTLRINVKPNLKPVVPVSDFDIKLLNLDGTKPHLPRVYDLDYGNTHEAAVSTKLVADFKGKTPTDPNVIFSVENNLTSLIIDDTLYGYKRAGKCKITATSVSNPSITKTLTVDVEPVKAESFELNVTPKEDIRVGRNYTITATFKPFNTYNEFLMAKSSDPTIAEVTPKGRTIAVTALKEGDVTITVTSESNPTISQDIKLHINKKVAIDESQEGEFKGHMRKNLGHFMLFLVNGLFTSIMFIYLRKKDTYKDLIIVSIISLLTGLFFASFSEFIQLFNGRGASLNDIGIDFSGYLVGSLIVLGITLIIKLVKKFKTKKLNK